MNCLICGAKLTKQDVCLQCGTDIRLYREIIQTSNRYYNLGLERAKRRDLTGAITALSQCLNLNKSNIDARNLLGLIYYERGEIVFAIREWVISKNFREKDNMADTYLAQVENTQKVLAGNIHRYNNALHYLEIGSRDLALIQLKRIASKPYPNIKAFQLLALLYMQDGMFQKAERLLKRCNLIDNGDSTTLRYMEALRERRQSLDGSFSDALREVTNQSQEDGDVIVPISAVREYSSYFVYVMYMAIGFVLGILLVFFIVVPSTKHMEQSNAKAMLSESHREITNLRTDILKLEADKDKLNLQIKELMDQITKGEADIGSSQDRIEKLYGLIDQYKVLLNILDNYLAEDYLSAMSGFLDLDATYENDETYHSIYNALKQDIDTNMWYRLYYTGVKRLNEQEFASAAEMLAQAYKLHETSPEVIFYLGYAYERTEQWDLMKLCYYKLCEEFSDGVWAQQAQDRLHAYGF